VPREALELLGFGAGFTPDSIAEARTAMQQNLESLTVLLSDRPYLITDHPTLADFAVAGLTMYVKFPSGGYLNLPGDLAGKGVPGLADNPAYATFWQWRDRLYVDYRKLPASSGSGSSEAEPAPTSIEIE
jgi:glutathione S-transferase